MEPENDRSFEPLKRPVVFVCLIGPTSKRFQLYPILDSGADKTFIARAIAEDIGVDLSLPPITSSGVGGDIQTVETHVDIEFIGPYERRMLMEVPIIVPLDHKHDLALLGRQGVFKYFKIIIEEYRDLVTFIEPGLVN